MTLLAGGYVLDSDLADLVALQQSWVPYVPSFATTGTQPTMGNSSISGEYISSGKMLLGRIRLDVGSTYSNGTGTWIFGLPSGRILSTTGQCLGPALLRDQSANSHAVGVAFSNATTTFEVRGHGINVMGAGVPAALATGDWLVALFQGELA